MFEHFCWQPLSVLCEAADAIPTAFTTTRPAISRTEGKGKKGRQSTLAVAANRLNHSLCESLRAAPSLQRSGRPGNGLVGCFTVSVCSNCRHIESLGASRRLALLEDDSALMVSYLLSMGIRWSVIMAVSHYGSGREWEFTVLWYLC